MYKYLINENLSNLPMKDYKNALKVIPLVLGVSPNTFLNYRNIKAGEKKTFPNQKVVQLEKMFGLSAGELQNTRISCKHITQLLEDYKNVLR
jgi:hypothetical protein